MRSPSSAAASKNSKQAQATTAAPKPFGTVYYVSGEQYKGEWRDNKRHGQGVVTYKNGDRYGGEWVGGKRHGNGTLWVLRGGKFRVRYSGDWQQDLPEGSGVYFDDEGSSYEGEFAAGLRHGRGRAVTGAGAAAAAGCSAGDVYEGCWQHDKRHGPGTLMLSSGDLFEGHWAHDLKHGPGTYFYMAKGCRYDGVWHEGTPRCGTYAEIQPAPPGAPGALPNIELLSPDDVLQEAEAAAAAGASMACDAAQAAAAAVAGLAIGRESSLQAGSSSYDEVGGWVAETRQQHQQHTACTITAVPAAGVSGDGGAGLAF